MARRTLWFALLGLLAARPAAAHDLAAAELARLQAFVAAALDSGWIGLLLLAGAGVALGALHGLEPGHSKTMMSAFIIAIRGSVRQAALLGAAATVSHTAVVWLLVLPLLAWGGAIDVQRNAPYFQIASALAVLAVATWTAVRLWRARPPGDRANAIRSRDTATGDIIDTGHGLARLELVAVEGAARFRISGVARSGRAIAFNEAVTVTTQTSDGITQEYAFAGELSIEAVPAPHRFAAALRIAHGDHGHSFALRFAGVGTPATLENPDGDDGHTRAHVAALRARLAGGRRLSTWQVVLFGLGGGLLPCPAAVTVLLLCLQLQRLGLGLLLVASFSAGLAITLIAVGALAALGTRQAARAWPRLTALAPLATYASCALIMAIGLYMLAEGIDALA